MDTSDLRNPFDEDHVLAFVKTEAFYLVVVAFVVILHISTILILYSPDHVSLSTRDPIDQMRYMESYSRTLDGLKESNPSAATFPVAVQTFHTALLLVGVIALIGLIARRYATRLRMANAAPGLDAAPPAWGLWDVIKLAACLTAGGIAMQAIFGSQNDVPLGTPRSCIAHIFSQVLMLGVLFHIVVGERGGRLADLGFHARGLGRAVAFGLIGFLAVQPLLFGVEWAQWQVLQRFIRITPMQSALQTMLTTPFPAAFWMSIVIAGLIAPVIEELLFRGLLQSGLRRWVSPTASIVVSAAFFAAAHMDLFNFLPLFVLGLALGYVYARSRSIVAPIVLHVAYNIAGLMTVFAIRYVHTVT